ncbi:MAG: aldo/keto reductase [archaeon]
MEQVRSRRNVERMKYTRVGNSGLKISRICLGTNNFGRQVNEDDSLRIIRKAIDLGINLIDTANTYAKGKSEEIVGKAVQGYRDHVIIATKVGSDVAEGWNRGGLSRKHILWQFKQSLTSLRTDFIDLYYLHRFDPETPLEETLRTINDLIRQEKVRYIACSNFTAWQIAKAHEICEKLGLEKFIAVQPQYNLFQRAIEKELLPYCSEERLGVTTYSPLMGGFLTGKYLTDGAPPPGSRASHNPAYWERIKNEGNFTTLKHIKTIADSLDLPLSHLAVAWILKNPNIAAPIVGASTPEQVEENCRIVEIDISDETYKRLSEITQL